MLSKSEVYGVTDFKSLKGSFIVQNSKLYLLYMETYIKRIILAFLLYLRSLAKIVLILKIGHAQLMFILMNMQT